MSSNALRVALLIQRDGAHCVWCSADLHTMSYDEIKMLETSYERRTARETKATLDHVLPQSLDGSRHLDNLMLACPGCNVERGNIDAARAIIIFAEMGQDVREDVVRAAIKRSLKQPYSRRKVIARKAKCECGRTRAVDVLTKIATDECPKWCPWYDGSDDE